MATLQSSVLSLASSLTLLTSSISILDEGVHDFPRLRRVLTTQRHFELLPESHIKEAQQSLAEEIAPAVDQLLSTAERAVEQMARREGSLRAKFELLEGRAGGQQGSGAARNAPRTSRMSVMGDAKSLQLKRLQQKKDQLQYTIERLELQSKQRERELRKSMAFIKDG